jgi:hypothetical protein
MATATPNPLRIACTECHRDMCVEFQSHEPHDDSVVVAAECECGRLIGVIDGLLILQLVRDGRPLIAAGIQNDPALGDYAKERLAALQTRMATYERWIAAATWAREKPRKAPL